MSSSAPTGSALLSRLRTSFAQPSQLTGPTLVADSQTQLPVSFSTPTLQPNELNEELDLFENILSEVESEVAASQIQSEESTALAPVLPQVIEQATDTLNPAGLVVGSTAKEALDSGRSAEYSSLDAAGGIQYVEQEKSPEIPVEVESFLQKVDNHYDQQPAEIVIADGTVTPPPVYVPKQQVIVIPITPEMEKAGEKKSPAFSLRWLVEWSHKIIRMFNGRVVYKQVESQA
jgi:hypothetical protein